MKRFVCWYCDDVWYLGEICCDPNLFSKLSNVSDLYLNKTMLWLRKFPFFLWPCSYINSTLSLGTWNWSVVDQWCIRNRFSFVSRTCKNLNKIFSSQRRKRFQIHFSHSCIYIGFPCVGRYFETTSRTLYWFNIYICQIQHCQLSPNMFLIIPFNCQNSYVVKRLLMKFTVISDHGKPFYFFGRPAFEGHINTIRYKYLEGLNG